MEETNYDRKHEAPSVPQSGQQIQSAPKPERGGSDGEKDQKIPEGTDSPASDPVDYENGEIQWPRKTFRDKLDLRDNPRPNRLLNIMLAPFKGFTYPAVVYAG